MQNNKDFDKKKKATDSWKASGIGLAIGTIGVVGTAMYVAHKLSKEKDLNGAALITKTLSTIGGGSIESGGRGMMGGLQNLCSVGVVGVVAGSSLSIVYDLFKNAVSSDDNKLIDE